jgi:uncharacterized membrane protein
LGSGIGLIASFIQTIERISWADDKNALLACDINSVFSCSSVFDSWQSSVFGFSNSIMCLAFFGVMLGIGLAGLFGSQLDKKLRLIMHFFSVFFLLFGAWYLYQSAMVISALCLFCIFCYSGVIAINWGWLRLNANDLPLSQNIKKSLTQVFSKGADTFFWIIWGLLFVAMFVLKFY